MVVVYYAWPLSTGKLKELAKRVYKSQTVGHVETFLRSALCGWSEKPWPRP